GGAEAARTRRPPGEPQRRRLPGHPDRPAHRHAARRQRVPQGRLRGGILSQGDLLTPSSRSGTALRDPAWAACHSATSARGVAGTVGNSNRFPSWRLRRVMTAAGHRATTITRRAAGGVPAAPPPLYAPNDSGNVPISGNAPTGRRPV